MVSSLFLGNGMLSSLLSSFSVKVECILPWHAELNVNTF